MVQMKATPVLPDILGATVRSARATPLVDQFEPFLASMCFIENHHQNGDPFTVAAFRIDLLQQRSNFLEFLVLTLICTFHVLLLE